jgi:hypothetical protein
MWFRRRSPHVIAEGPIVYDRHGRPVGVRAPAPPTPDEPPQVRRVRSLESLRRTRELEAQYSVRCQVSLFCADPPR